MTAHDKINSVRESQRLRADERGKLAERVAGRHARVLGEVDAEIELKGAVEGDRVEEDGGLAVFGFGQFFLEMGSVQGKAKEYKQI